MARAKKNVDFEQSLDQLETLVDAMENGDLSLEESLKAFEQGVKLTRECQTALNQAEQKVQKLIAENEELRAVPLDDDEGDLDE